MSQMVDQVNGYDVYAKRAECDEDGNNIKTTYATKAELPDGVPAVTSSDDGKVLKATYSGGVGSYAWETESGGTQVQADWTESDTTDPSYIQNKPEDYDLVAGSNVTITKNDNDKEITVAASFAQAQADWSQSDSSAADYIKNKPTIPVVPTTDQTYNSSSTNPQSGTAVAQAISDALGTVETALSNL